MRAGLLLVCLLLVLPAAAGGAAPLRVVLVGDYDDARITRVADAVELALSVDSQAVQLSRYAPERLPGAAAADLLIAIGSRAGHDLALAASGIPTLYSFLPQAAWIELDDCCVINRLPYSALFLDQPLPRLFDLVRLFLPDASHVALLLGEVSAGRRDELQRVAAEAGFDLLVADVDEQDQIGSSLRRLANDADVLLALPDPRVYNRNTAYPILLTTYSARMPVIGFSDAMVRAGAAAAVFATPEDVGREIAQRVRDFQRSGTLPPPGFGNHFSVSVNDAVTRSLRLPDHTAADLKIRLQERTP